MSCLSHAFIIRPLGNLIAPKRPFGGYETSALLAASALFKYSVILICRLLFFVDESLERTHKPRRTNKICLFGSQVVQGGQTEENRGEREDGQDTAVQSNV